MSESQKPIKRADRPPPRKGPTIDVVRLGGGHKIHGTVLCHKLWGCWVHWDKNAGRKGRTVQCLENPENCDGCRNGLPSKCRWYLTMIVQNRGLCFLELTDQAAQRFLDQAGAVPSFRGMRVTFTRTNADNGRIRVEVHETWDDPDRCPPDQDPEPILRWLWNWQRQ